MKDKINSRNLLGFLGALALGLANCKTTSSHVPEPIDARWNSVVEMNNLGERYMDGIDVQKSYVEAAKYFRIAAEKGFGPAQHSLGSLYAEGKGVPQNDHEAFGWFRKAAEQGLAPSQYLVGFHYIGGVRN